MSVKRLESLLPDDLETLSVCLDLETTLAACHDYFLEQYNEKHGTDYQRSDIDHWDWVREEVEFEEFMEIVDVGWRDNHEAIQPTEPGLAGLIDRLYNHPAIELDIVTARTGVEDGMKRWLATHSITGFDSFISTTESKANFDYHVYIDDSPRLAFDLSATQMQFLIAGPHNTAAIPHDRTITVNTVRAASTELFRYLDERSEQ